MNTTLANEKGVGVISFLVIIAAAAIGYCMATFALRLVGAGEFQSSIRFSIALFALFLTPLWALYSELKRLKDRDELTKRELREVNHRVKLGEAKLLRIAVFLFFCAFYVACSGLWPAQSPKFTWFAGATGAFLAIAFVLVCSILLNFRELNAFEVRLAERKKRVTQSKQLLERLQAKNND